MHDQDRDEHTDEIAAFENKWAAGFTKVDGRYVPADGLVNSKGRRLVFPDGGPDAAELDDWTDRLEVVAKQVLHGRNATVFEGRVLDPLMGRRKRSVEELAAQFGVTSAKIHKITEKAKERVAAAVRRYKQGKSLAPEEPACPTCGRYYRLGWAPCRRGYGEGAEDSPFTHPECFPPRFRRELELKRESMRNWLRHCEKAFLEGRENIFPST